MLSRIYLFSIILLFTITFSVSFAQHHGGQQAPPVSFGSGEVTVNTSLFPADFMPGKNSDVNLKIRFFDISTNVNIQSVTYRVQIFFGNQLVANQMFFDKDGELDVKIQPKSICDQEELWKCTKYQGEIDPVVPNALTSSASSKPIIIGPVFSKSGQYTVKTDIIGATNPKTQTTEDITFETSITIPHEQQFSIKASNTQYFILVKNFQESITNLQYDESSNSIIFQMPFDWEHIEHIDSIKNYLEIPKNFSSFQNVDSFTGTVNGISIIPTDLHYDKYSTKNANILHFTIGNDELKKLKGTNSEIKVVITPDLQSSIINKEIFFDNGYKAIVSYDSRDSLNKKLLFSFSFFDAQRNLASDVRYGYSVKDPLGKETVNTGSNPNLLGISLPSGVDTKIIEVPLQGKHLMKIVLIGIGQIDFERLMFKEFEFEIKNLKIPTTTQTTEKTEIPEWIKNNAGWWANNQIDDTSFVQGIQFMIKNKILNIPATAQGSGSGMNQIPSWIKSNAGWWASGQIDDNSFIQGIQYMIKEGIIRI
jgi:hypothetical protein